MAEFKVAIINGWKQSVAEREQRKQEVPQKMGKEQGQEVQHQEQSLQVKSGQLMDHVLAHGMTVTEAEQPNPSRFSVATIIRGRRERKRSSFLFGLFWKGSKVNCVCMGRSMNIHTDTFSPDCWQWKIILQTTVKLHSGNSNAYTHSIICLSAAQTKL